MSPHVEDILSHDLTLRFYTAVKEIKRQNNPHLLGDMFFALQHAIGDTVPWYKERNDHRAVFLLGSTTYVSHFAAANTVDIDQQAAQAAAAHTAAAAAAAHHRGENPAHHQMGYAMYPPRNSHSPPIGDLSPRPDYRQRQHQQPLQPQPKMQYSPRSMQPSHQFPMHHGAEKRKIAAATSGEPGLVDDRDWQTSKKGKKTHLKEKDLDTRRQELFHDLMRVTRAELHHSASLLSGATKDLIRTVMKPIPPTKQVSSPSSSSALQRLATLANTSPHSDVDYAPKNSGVYFNHDYAELYRCFLLFEREVGASQPATESQAPIELKGAVAFTNLDSPAGKPIVRLLRARLEPMLTSTTWEALKRRLTVGERVYTLTSELGGAFLLLSRAVSGRKLLHGFSNAEWREAIQSGVSSSNEPRHVLGANADEVRNLRQKFELEQYLQEDRADEDVKVAVSASEPSIGPIGYQPSPSDSSRRSSDASNAAKDTVAHANGAIRAASLDHDEKQGDAEASKEADISRRTRRARPSGEPSED